MAITTAHQFGLKEATLDVRKNVAKALVQYWTSFSSRLPRISPAEETWVKGETGSRDANRIRAVLQRREGSLYMLARRVEICLNASKNLSLSLGAYPNLEVVLWAELLNCNEEKDDKLIYLRHASLSNGILQRRASI